MCLFYIARPRALIVRAVAIVVAAAIQHPVDGAADEGERPQAEGVHEVTKGTIIDAWREARARVHAARFEFETHFIVDKRLRESMDREMEITTRTQVVDNEHVGYWRVTRISIDGVRLRWELLSKNDRANPPLKRLSIGATDGLRSKSLTVPGEISSLKFPGGHIRRSSLINAAGTTDMLPVFMAISPFYPDITQVQGDVLAFDKYSVAPRKRVGKMEYVVLELRNDNGRKRPDGEYWLDPNKGFAIVRFMHSLNGNLWHQFDIRYGHDPKGNWVPASWTLNIHDLGNGKLTEIRESRITKWESNPVFTASEFDFEFPPGTIVTE